MEKYLIHLHGREPLQFEVGAGQMIPGFDAGVEGMSIGDKKTISIPAAEGYGEWQEENVIAFPMENIPPDMKLEPGMELNLQSESGQPVQVIVLEVQAGSGVCWTLTIFWQGKI